LSLQQAIKLIPDTVVDLELTPLPEPVVGEEPSQPEIIVAPVGPSLPPVTPVFNVETTTTPPQIEVPSDSTSSSELINLENGVISSSDPTSSFPLLP